MSMESSAFGTLQGMSVQVTFESSGGILESGKWIRNLHSKMEAVPLSWAVNAISFSGSTWRTEKWLFGLLGLWQPGSDTGFLWMRC